MKFNDLNEQEQLELHLQLTKYAKSVGGINNFLTIIDNIRETKPKCLLNKTAIFHYNGGTIQWTKSIFKDTLTRLFVSIDMEDRTGDMIKGLNVPNYKQTMNMMRTLSPIEVDVLPKDDELEGFSFNILDTSVKNNTKITLIFKIMFYFNIDFAKKILSYQIKED